MAENFQIELRNSAVWDEMVAEFGEQKALKIISECKAELVPPDKEP